MIRYGIIRMGLRYFPLQLGNVRPITPGRCIRRAQSDNEASSSQAKLMDDSGKGNSGPIRLDHVTARCDSFTNYKSPGRLASLSEGLI